MFQLINGVSPNPQLEKSLPDDRTATDSMWKKREKSSCDDHHQLWLERTEGLKCRMQVRTGTESQKSVRTPEKCFHHGAGEENIKFRAVMNVRRAELGIPETDMPVHPQEGSLHSTATTKWFRFDPGTSQILPKAQLSVCSGSPATSLHKPQSPPRTRDTPRTAPSWEQLHP